MRDTLDRVPLSVHENGIGAGDRIDNKATGAGSTIAAAANAEFE